MTLFILIFVRRIGYEDDWQVAVRVQAEKC